MSYPEATPRPKKTKSLIPILGCGGLALSCVFCLVGAWVIGKRDMDAIEPAAAACRGEPVPEAAPYTPGGAQRFAFFQNTDRGWRLDLGRRDTSLPLAENVAEATLTVCLGASETVSLERCSYVDGHVVERRQPSRRVRVVATQSGQTVRETLVAGNPPADCPETFSTGGGGGGGVSVRVLGIPVASVGGEDEVEATPEILEGTAAGHAHFSAAFADL